MAIFKKPPKPKVLPPDAAATKKRKSLVAKVQEVAKKSAVDWITKTFSYYEHAPHFDTEKVAMYVERELSEMLHSVILNAVGIERESFGPGWKAIYNGLLRKEIEDVAKAQAGTMVKKFLSTQEKKLPAALPEKFRKAVEKEYEEAYKDAAMQAARELGEAKGAEDIDAIVAGVLKA